MKSEKAPSHRTGRTAVASPPDFRNATARSDRRPRGKGLPDRNAPQMKPTDADIRRALARLKRALEKSRREIRSLREMLEQSEADGFPGDDYAEMDELLGRVVAMAKSEQARQQAKVLRAGGLSPGQLGRFGASGPQRAREEVGRGLRGASTDRGAER